MKRETVKKKIYEKSAPSPYLTKHTWGIILAGGEGKRLQSYVQKLYGYPRPKQYCALFGTRSMLSHTKDRVTKLISPKKLLTVVNKNHLQYISEEFGNKYNKNILIQPAERGTTAGILFPLLEIYKSDPLAVVSIFPSDQFINQEKLFMNYVREANLFVEKNKDKIVILGVHPEKPESGCGWIEPGDKIDSANKFSFMPVLKFWEKPDKETLSSLWKRSCLCNTFVLVGRCSSFIDFIKINTPEVYASLCNYCKYSQSCAEAEDKTSLYSKIPDLNFSRSVLEKMTDRLFVLEVKGVYWSDWGEEKRVKRDLRKLRSSI